MLFLPGWGMRATVFDGLRARLRARPRDDRVVIGWSLGAQRAIAHARRDPAVERLVLIAATPCFVARDNWLHGMSRMLFDDFACGFERDGDATLSRFMSLQGQGDLHAKAVIRALRAAQRGANDAALRDELRELSENDLRATVPAVSQPTLIVHGEHDSLVPVEAAEYLAGRLPNARLQIVAGAGHAPFLSDPDRVARSIDDFLDE